MAKRPPAKVGDLRERERKRGLQGGCLHPPAPLPAKWVKKTNKKNSRGLNFGDTTEQLQLLELPQLWQRGHGQDRAAARRGQQERGGSMTPRGLAAGPRSKARGGYYYRKPIAEKKGRD